jgi:signal transduction histidine kinase/CheY-like chemotaxis protein
LIVEDEHLVALDLQVRLKHMGHQPDVAYSGEEAVQKATQNKFDLLLMDIKLKGALDGIEAAKVIRETFDVPIIYLTAYADNHTLDRARYTEPYGYILKPFQERELKAAIEMALRRHAHDKQRSQQQVLERFLAEASAHMATSLDYRAVARGTAELIVPRYADWCLIHLREAADEVPAFSFSQPTGDDRPVSSPLIDMVERTGRPEMISAIAGTGAYRDAFGTQHVETLRDLGARSLMCVPLVVRDHVLGSLALVSGKTRARYTASDLAFVEDLARRLAVALDNALLYRRAERAILMRDDVLAVVSHDLRTPLSTILMQAELLSSHEDLGSVGHAIGRAAQRMNRLIGDLLDASAINSGQLALDVGNHRADELVHEAAEPFRSMAETRGIALEELASREVGTVRCDRDRMLQALSNLIDNALRFTPRGGKVCVAAKRDGDGVQLEVRDTGRGIPPEQLPHLFDRFWRGQARRGGAGLGLFITKGIVGAHESSLQVESTVNVGSRFHFTLRAGS